MLSSTILLALSAALAGFSSAQETVKPCCDIDINSVELQVRQEWCRAERNTCPEICGGIGKLAPNGNNCDANTLNYTCVCSDGTKPNMSDYQQSLPAQQCREWFNQCITSHPNDIFAQEECKNVSCGNKTTAELVRSSSSSSAEATPAATQSQSSGSSPTDSAPEATSASATGAAVALGYAREFGTPVLAAGILAAFGLAL